MIKRALGEGCNRNGTDIEILKRERRMVQRDGGDEGAQ